MFVTAAPEGETPLQTGREQNAIMRAVGGHFQLESIFAANPADLVHQIAIHRPQVIHFAGHGTGKEGLLFEGRSGESILLTWKALNQLLAAKELMASVQLIVLNACWSISQAKEISAAGPDAVGMKRDVLDTLAVAFADSFYQTLRSLSPAGACAAAIAAVQGMGLEEADSPVFCPGTAPLVASLNAVPSIREQVDERWPGLELKALIADQFPDYHRQIVDTDWKRLRLLLDFITWVGERNAMKTKLTQLIASTPPA
ncbi:CHAT domain-containing protein [Prosthecobacter fusiformis]|uniref:CHAT domain-containing protein n=2 Tax=Prosthecobacter fusiformis TaxID=48464 RepID=A0A4V3FI26_9BACT|nr:CHAT domain-containing protein [Prosthecobacter fusiformis]